MSQAVRLSDEETHKQSQAVAELSKLFLRFTSEDGSLRGFAGVWTFYRVDSADDADINSTFRCLRTYEAIGTDPVSIYFRTFNETEPSNGKAALRLQDGLFESGHSRPANDPFFSEAMSLTAIERREGLPECSFWRCAAVDAEDLIRIAPMLPPPPMESSSEAINKYPGWSPQNIAMGVFAFESFIEDGDRRWSMGALYSVHSLRLLSHFCIAEHAVTVQPLGRIDFETLPFGHSSERLDSECKHWMDGGSFRGEMSEVVWDEDGDIEKLPTRPATWSPPVPSSTHRLFLYKDCKYALYPLELPVVADASVSAFAQGARFEMGGIVNQEQDFRRLILRYSLAGHVTSLTKELYRSGGTFEFEKRLSISMRRSHSSHPTGSPQVSARRLGARVANLERAMSQTRVNKD